MKTPSPRAIKPFSDVKAELSTQDIRCKPEDVSFFHSIMCQVALPRSKPSSNRFERHCGNAAILLTAGSLWDGKNLIEQPLPYGALPRLIFAWANTYAIINRTRTIPVGDSMSEFLSLLGKSKSGGRNGTATMLKKQMLSLAACHITLGYNEAGKSKTYKGQPIEGFETWEKTPEGQKTLWPGTITLSQTYFEALIEHAVPFNIRALSYLQGSALAIDIYVWLAERLHRIEGKSVTLRWNNLREQFGQEYTGDDADKNFKKAFVPALNKVIYVYPEAKVKIIRGGLMLMPSAPPVPYREGQMKPSPRLISK